jgi:hypothetical protein
MSTAILGRATARMPLSTVPMSVMRLTTIISSLISVAGGWAEIPGR